MPPNQTISPESSGQHPPNPPVINPSMNLGPASPKPYKKIIMVLLGVVILALLGGAAYAFNQKRVTNQKFNALAADIKKQELDGLRQYAKVASITNDLGNMLDLATSDNPPSDITQKLTSKVTTLKSSIDASCDAKSDDLTKSRINTRISGLKLSAAQKKYVSDIKEVLSGLEATGYSNVGMCTDGPALVSFADNFAKILPGLNALGEVSANPTPTQLEKFKEYADVKLSDEASLKAKLPQTWQLLKDMQEMIKISYNILSAGTSGDFATILRYATQLDSLTTTLQTDLANFNAEVNGLDKAENSAATKASLAEIAAIEYQESHNVSNPNMQLDKSVPGFRIADASITDYDDAHNHYPSGTSVNDIAGLDDNMRKLKDKNILKNLTYTSLGSDNSGFNLSAKLSDGSSVSERVDASQQSA